MMKKAMPLLLVFSLLCTMVSCKLFHQHTWKDATCAEPKTCSVCGETEGEALGHTWVDTTCTEPKTCSVCGATEGEALGHTWKDATCTEPKTCSVCGATEGEALGHTWVDATCTEPKTCSVCGETEGEALGHTWVDATCTEPKTCSVCGATEGEALGHTWVDATCTEPKTCSVCGATEGEALGHTTTTSICARCGHNFGKWMPKHDADESQPETDVWYITYAEKIIGTFSSTAATDSLLKAQVLANEHEVAIVLYENGSDQVKNVRAPFVDTYDILIKDDNGKIAVTGIMYCGGDLLFVDGDYVSEVIQVLSGTGSVSFYIVKRDSPTTTYAFTVDCSNFSELFTAESN